MFPWLHNAHAGYVLAAYSIALAALVGLVLVSWVGMHRLEKKWRRLHRERRGWRRDA
jgi:heme exporter protein CcmD